MNSMTTKRVALVNSAILLIILVLSYFSLEGFEFFGDSEAFRLFVIPGVIYALFLVFLFRGDFSYQKLVLYFLLLAAAYVLAVYVCFFSYGMAVPVVGALGAFMIDKLFPSKEKESSLYIYLFTITGFITSLLGWLTIMYFDKQLPFDAGFPMIILPWQLGIGVLCIRRISSVEV